MSKPTLEERVTELEGQVADLIAVLEKRNGWTKKTDWQRSMEVFADEPIMPEIIEEGRKIREADRKR
jgi:hypothetical protein